MICVSDDILEGWLKEDVPYLDLTSHLLDLGGCDGEMRFRCRDEAVICGTEEVARLSELKGCSVIESIPSGSKVHPGQVFMRISGKADALHLLWKVAVNILEYASGIASRTNRMVEKTRKVNEKAAILATRKIFPGTKDLSIKAVLSGGGIPHRLGLSETILIFEQHRVFLESSDRLYAKLKTIKTQCCEKKIMVEVDEAEDAVRMCREGADVLQFDKWPSQKLAEFVREIKRDFPHILTTAAGGINENNVEEYAATGVDAIVTTSMYFGKPVNIGVTMEAKG